VKGRPGGIVSWHNAEYRFGREAKDMVSTTTAAAAPEQRDGFVYHANLPYTLGSEAAYRAKIGLVVLANDWTIEYEVNRITALDGVTVYANRLYFDPLVSMETLRAMEGRIADAVTLINPPAQLDVVAYGCTSGTIAIGKDKVFERIRSVRPGVACTTPIVAGVEGAKALGARRLALVTPYVEDVTLGMRDFVVDEGLEVPVVGTFNNPVDDDVAHTSGESLTQAILALGSTDVDAVFVSCTSLHVTGVIPRCEAELGKPVISSNQALAWHALRLAGVNDRLEGWGRLLAEA
jgi:maleate isomerase